MPNGNRCVHISGDIVRTYLGWPNKEERNGMLLIISDVILSRMESDREHSELQYK
jgi:hypothetical protein